MTSLDPSDLVDLYWAGRATLVARREQIDVYDEVFRRFFLDAADPVRELLTLRAQAGAETQAVLEVPATDPAAEGNEEQAVLGLMASDVDTLRHKSFAACTPGRAGGAAPDHDQDPADPAAAADPPHRRQGAAAAHPTSGGPSAPRCAPAASRPSCSGGSARCGSAR